MKNLILLYIFFFVSGITLAQSKKEMIAILNNRVDSLNQIVSSERSDKQKLNTEISNLNSQIKELERNNENLNKDKITLETKNNSLNQELIENQGQIVELNKQLKIKKDSLVLVTSELLKYKPAPPKEKLVVKQDNTGPIKTVTIGTQVWMKENLNVSVFKNGVAIPEVKDNVAWEKAGDNHQPAWCFYDNDPKNGAKYGKLYNWYAVIDTNGLCPQGWHVPSDAEWNILIEYLGGKWGGESKMKAKSGWNKVESDGSATCPVCSDWNTEYRRKTACHRCKDSRRIPAAITYRSGNGTDESGFTGLPGGYRNFTGSYDDIGDYGKWWSSSENNTWSSDAWSSNAWYRYLEYYNGTANRNSNDKRIGLSVRCLKD